MSHLLYSPSKVHTDDGQQGASIFNTTQSAVSLMPMIQPGSLIHLQQHDTQPAASFKCLPVLVG
ncbi:uncharacterized protein HD556DRAFT_1238774 [Suillus plorans]|uniref:Uncharacterized protein n=1 Tax=Suillus plorans TaxID=116603 RepID=A0A9P7DG31_9AGAM|nr:uncharacterized protein HD556DRAFT_1238774 [Suillus plorans]KAG1792756.1 hypothetical protein HD556DRAFT_1238774 [Suillus plorans]